ncbi:metal-sulfur cluster assembly factor [Candidatus Woesearchaeota archaeon]|nr:metal-sulfur cluster assembly factor [Candidatus Woesearchaeota archaeon]
MFGEETPEIEQEEKEAEELLKEEEDILEQIEHDTETGVEQKEETRVSEIIESEEAKTEAQNSELQKSTNAGLQKVSKEEMEAKEENKPIIKALKTIEDPELGVDIWTLGLIYNLDYNKEEKKVHVLMTFTSIMCPVGPMIVQSIEQKIKLLPDIEKVSVEVVFAPPWEPTDELREMLGV